MTDAVQIRRCHQAGVRHFFIALSAELVRTFHTENVEHGGDARFVLIAEWKFMFAQKVVDDGPLGIAVNTRTRRHRLICIEQRFDFGVRAEAVRPFSRKQP